MGRVKGIGGIFFKVADRAATRQWYEEHLGFKIDEHGTNFEWRQADQGKLKGFTQWSPFAESSDYFEQSVMINYRVEDLDGLLVSLKAKGVQVVDEIQAFDYGRFIHIIDGDGTKIELWEPNDIAYDDMLGDARTK